MKQFFAVLSLLIFTTIAVGQTQKATEATAPKPPETVRLEPQAQAEIAEAQRQAEEAKTALAAATANNKAAQQLVATLVFKAMAESKYSPKEWAVRQDQGGIYLERLKPAETAAAPAGQHTPPQAKTP